MICYAHVAVLRKYYSLSVDEFVVRFRSSHICTYIDDHVCGLLYVVLRRNFITVIGCELPGGQW